ncbi:VWA domain-containing protein [Deinococcus maricopensis]|uniref:von Willebrand factor type A n=1 Tax=Deinococcus maricopensis (strain DSM 21211 / LMG 22137 / NRRL B-23946 / LB-34) TaxID=709986 RepID=E8U693_DEIML|nr:VWA domain-containing protein [Deinococcus maricopensis]ADV66582.1 von Willebrand factor type A [Deinococcus maricopensis DSM 21211]
MKRALLAALAVTLAGCAARPTPPLTVLGGSELRDLAPILEDVARASGVRLNIQYVGTLDGTERLRGGATPDLVWFSHAKYLELQDDLRGRVIAREKIMLSPVVLGVNRRDARAWGWTGRNASWRDIARKVASGDLKYGMANPAASNSGLTALIGVTAALSGKGDAITAADARSPELRAFFRGQALTAGSSGWLADAYIRDQARLNGLINYESVLLSLNRGGQLREPLTLIYPRDGLITADYPLLLLNPAQQAPFRKLVDALRAPAVQARIMRDTLRRPVNTTVPLTRDFPDALLLELPFPRSASTLDAVVSTYLQDTRQPANTIFVLDVSGSMRGARIDALKTALRGLSGADTTLTGRYATFANRERVTLIPFSSAPGAPRTTELTPATRGAALKQLRAQVDALTPDGGTNIYGALQAAYEQARAAPAGRYTSIVLMTDGERTEGPSADQFRATYAALPERARQVKTFTVLFGDSDATEMNRIATLTGGRTFDGQNDLRAAFKDIRGYQ